MARSQIPKKMTAVQRLPLTKARINLGAVVKHVHVNKEYVILEKDGIPIAGLMDIEEFEDYLELRDPQIRRHILKSQQAYTDGKSRPATHLLEELQHTPTKKKYPRRKA